MRFTKIKFQSKIKMIINFNLLKNLDFIYIHLLVDFKLRFFFNSRDLNFHKLFLSSANNALKF